MGMNLTEVKEILPPTVENLTTQGIVLESVVNQGTKCLCTSDRCLLSEMLEDICHTIFLPNICGGFKVIMCTSALFYFYVHWLEILGLAVSH